MFTEHKYEVIFRRLHFDPFTQRAYSTFKRVTTYASDAKQAVLRVRARLAWKYQRIPVVHVGLLRFNVNAAAKGSDSC